MQKSKKKLIVKVIAIFLAIVIIAVGSFGGYLLYRFNCDKSNATNNYDTVYSADQVKLSTDDNGIFKVLKINDTHFFDGVCEDDKHTLEDLRVILDKTPCDFIVVDGDLVEGFNLKPTYDKFGAIDLFSTLIEEYDTPWTFAYVW